MGGIRLNTQQQVKLFWLAEARRVSPEQILSDIMDEYLGKTVPKFSIADRTKLDQEIVAIAKKFNKPSSIVKSNLLANKGYRYHLNDVETKSYSDYLRLTGEE
jgi:hypothetical protein